MLVAKGPLHAVQVPNRNLLVWGTGKVRAVRGRSTYKRHAVEPFGERKKWTVENKVVLRGERFERATKPKNPRSARQGASLPGIQCSYVGLGRTPEET